MRIKQYLALFRSAGWRLRRWLVLLLMLSATLRVRAQYIDFWQAQQQAARSPWLPRMKYINMDVEAERDNFNSSGNGQQNNERLYLSPSVGMEWDYYIYHPYLLTYSALLEPAYVLRYDGPASAVQRTSGFMLDGKFSATVLQLKPYATTFTYNRNYGEVQYDVFNSAMVDSQGYGVSTGYREGPVPVTVSYQQTHDVSTGFNQTSTTDQNMLDVHARNERGSNTATDFNYQFGQFDRDLSAGGIDYLSKNSYQHASIMDSEQFERSLLKSTLLFYDIDSNGSSSQQVNGTVNYDLDITPHLQNYDNYSFSYFTGNGAESIQNFATVGIQHHLFDSLVSSLEVRGSTLNSRTFGTTLDALSGAVSGSLDYSKKLGDWGRLSIGNSASYTWNQQEVTGSQTLIPNEAYTVPANGLIVLKQPRDVSITSVMTANNIPLIQGQDYNVLQTTDPWQIQIVPLGPAAVQPGSTILVTYTVLSNPSGSYTTFADSAQVTLYFWGERANVFLRYNFSENYSSSPDFILDNFNELQTGAELNWRGLSLHGDYTDHRDTFYSYHGYNLLENYSLNLSSESTISIALSQQWLMYPPQGTINQSQSLTFYNFMLRHEWRPVTALSIATEAGYRMQRGFGFDQDLFVFRSYLNWHIGKAELHLGYEHETQTLTSEQMIRNFAFIRMRRIF